MFNGQTGHLKSFCLGKKPSDELNCQQNITCQIQSLSLCQAAGNHLEKEVRQQWRAVWPIFSTSPGLH